MNNKSHKTTYNCYSVWEYEKEINELNEASKNGWQLRKGGCFHSKYTYDTSKRYIYQLDYNPNLKDKENYLSFFKEQNWEPINSTFNGWHYFRKPYHENMNEADLNIYTDKQSLHEMENRWVRNLIILTILYFLLSIAYVYFSIKEQQLVYIIESIMFIFLTIIFSLVLFHVNKKRTGKTTKFLIPMKYVMPITFLLILLSILSLTIGPSTKTTAIYAENFNFINTREAKLPNQSKYFDIKKDGTYKLNLYFRTNRGYMTILLEDEDNNPIYKNTAKECNVSNELLILKQGSYHIRYEYDIDEYDMYDSDIFVDWFITK